MSMTHGMVSNNSLDNNATPPPHSDNVEEELQRIQAALRAVFSANLTASDPQQQQFWHHQRQIADRYLTSFQATEISWIVCDRLLLMDEQSSSPTDSEESFRQQCRFFAAQTLHTKCRSDVHQLPEASLPSLRDSLLQQLYRYTSITGNGAANAVNVSQGAFNNMTINTGVSSALTTRLALCVSALAVQMGWTTILDDLMSTQRMQSHQTTNTHDNVNTLHAADSSNRVLLLLVLRVLPEECASDRLLLLDEGNRFRMRDHLVANASRVFHFLQESMDLSTRSSQIDSVNTAQTQQQQACTRVLEAFHTWIRWVPVHPQSLVETPLLKACVHALSSHSFLLEPAADVVVEALRMYPSHQQGNEGIVQLMIPLLSQLPLDQALQSQDEDVCRAFCRVVTELGESYMSLILSNKYYPQAMQLVQWVLKCSGEIHDPDIAGITLHFWYRMVMDLEVIVPYDYRQELVDSFTPYLLALIDVCALNLMKFPADLVAGDDDRLDDLHRHRFYVSETVEDCCRLLGGQSILKRLGALLKNQVNQEAVTSSINHPDWQGIESCLACIVAIHRFIPSDESDVLPFIFQLIPQLPSNVGPLRFTASKLIGKFASWLAMHPNYSQPLLPYLAVGLSVPECASSAAIAIKELCECSNQSFAISEPVLQLYQEIVAQPGRIDLADELQILEGVCRALSRQIQDRQEDGLSLLTRLVQPFGEQLATSVTDPASYPRRIIPEIERLTVVIQFFNIPQIPPNNHPLVDLMSSTWSLLDVATSRFPHDNLLAEKICRLHKHALRSIGAKAYAPAAGALMQQLIKSFEQTHQSPFLYAASICITEYGHDPDYSLRLFDMVATMATTTFTFLRNQDEMTNHPDVVEEFFYLMERMISHCPEPLVTSPLLQSLFQCAAVGMRLDHPGANKGILRFLESTISFGLSLREQNKPDCQAALERVLNMEGQGIVFNLAQAIVGDLPMSSRNSNQIPEILWKLNLLCPDRLAQWLTLAFNSTQPLLPQTPSSASSTVEMLPLPVPERAKMDFMGALDTGLARDEFSMAARAFQSACERERRLRRVGQRSL